MCRLICLWDCNTLQSRVTGDVFDPAGDYSSLWTGQADFFPLLFLLPSFISGNVGSYYPSWSDFSRDTAIPRELSLPKCNSIHSQLDCPVIYRKSPALEKLSSDTHICTCTHTHTLGILRRQLLMCWVSGRHSSRPQWDRGSVKA